MSTNPKELNPKESSEQLIAKSRKTVDRNVRAVMAAMESEDTLVSETPSGRLQRVLTIYGGIRPLFAVLGKLPLIPATWRASIVVFDQALAALAAVGTEVDAGFKAGKDL